MSYAFNMSFATAANEKEAFVLARRYVEKCMEEKNAKKIIEDNDLYIPSSRFDTIGEEAVALQTLRISIGSKACSNSVSCIGQNTNC